MLIATMEEENKTLTKKHISERQRRARINSYLEEIQILTDEGIGTTSSARMEKAEVLERAVSYIQSTLIGADQNNNSNGVTDINGKEVYKNGYTECMNTILSHVSTSQTLCSETNYLKSYLENYLQNRMNQTPKEGVTQEHPPEYDTLSSTIKEEVDARNTIISFPYLDYEYGKAQFNVNGSYINHEQQNFLENNSSQDLTYLRFMKSENGYITSYPEGKAHTCVQHSSEYSNNIRSDSPSFDYLVQQDMSSDTKCSNWIKQEPDFSYLEATEISAESYLNYNCKTEGKSIVWRPW